MPEDLEFVIYKDGTMVGGMIERNCTCSAEAANKRIPETAHREQLQRKSGPHKKQFGFF